MRATVQTRAIDRGRAPDLAPLARRTLVDDVVDALIAGASSGLILPGDRIVEAEVAAKLRVSRVPVREALRVLESQGLVVSEPYKGIRLTPVTRARIDDLIEVRVALESAAARRAIREGVHRGEGLDALEAALLDLKRRARARDVSGFAAADTAFHRVFCGLAGNRELSQLWETLARQMTIVFGLSTLGKPMPAIVEEHRRLIDVFAAGDAEGTAREIEDHIRVQTQALDFEAIVARRRNERDRARESAAAGAGDLS